MIPRLSLVVAALLCASCTTTKYPIGASTPQTPDLTIAGTWQASSQFLHIIPEDKDRFVVAYINGPPGERPELDVVQATTALVGTNRFLNVGRVSDDLLHSVVWLDDDTLPEIEKKHTANAELWPLLYRLSAENKLITCFIDNDAAAAAVRSGQLAGTATNEKPVTVHIDAEPAVLDQFMASPSGTALFKGCWTWHKIH
ncbi:MAG TPA: hypothetical protein VGG10_21530 [Rhizomicrobium sp.]|jgi:hypothetical protein